MKCGLVRVLGIDVSEFDCSKGISKRRYVCVRICGYVCSLCGVSLTSEVDDVGDEGRWEGDGDKSKSMCA